MEQKENEGENSISFSLVQNITRYVLENVLQWKFTRDYSMTNIENNGETQELQGDMPEGGLVQPTEDEPLIFKILTPLSKKQKLQSYLSIKLEMSRIEILYDFDKRLPERNDIFINDYIDTLIAHDELNLKLHKVIQPENENTQEDKHDQEDEKVR